MSSKRCYLTPPKKHRQEWFGSESSMIAFESKKKNMAFSCRYIFFLSLYSTRMLFFPSIFRLFEIQLFDIGKNLPGGKASLRSEKYHRTLWFWRCIGDTSATLLWENSRWAVKKHEIPVSLTGNFDQLLGLNPEMPGGSSYHPLQFAWKCAVVVVFRSFHIFHSDLS